MADFVDLVDPELRDAALLMRQNMAEYTPMTRAKLKKRRAWMESLLPPLVEGGAAFTEHWLPHPHGPDVRVYVVNAKPGMQGPGIFHIHGGGFTASTARGSLPAIQRLAATLDVPIVTVDYRLAPETIWSGSLEDNYAALLWTAAHADEIGLDPGRLAVLGESAGGGHAALLTMALRERGGPQFAFQALVYPMLDDRAGTSRPCAEHIGYFGWNPAANRFGWQSFLGCTPGGRKVPREAVPARAEDLSGLPPAWIGVGGLDLFVDESVDYAARLNRAGVPAELLMVPGAFHGFDSFNGAAAISRRFTEAKEAALRRGLGIA